MSSPSSTSPAPRITDFANELLDCIAHNLSQADLDCLGLTSRKGTSRTACPTDFAIELLDCIASHLCQEDLHHLGLPCRNQTLRLTDLANELLDCIASNLCQADLYSFALACRKTKESAYTYLYQTYYNRDPKKGFCLFLRTICQRSDLAARVNTIDIRGWTYGESFSEEWESKSPWASKYEIENMACRRGTRSRYDMLGPKHAAICKTDRTRNTTVFWAFVEASAAAGLIPRYSWDTTFVPTNWCLDPNSDEDTQRYYGFIRDLWNGDELPQVLLMLAQLPNLRHIKLDCFHSRITGMQSMLLGFMPNYYKPFGGIEPKGLTYVPTLKRLSITATKDSRSSYSVDVTPATLTHCFPSLDTIQLRWVSFSSPNSEIYDYADKHGTNLPLHLRVASFFHCWDHYGFLDPISRHPGLEVFEHLDGYRRRFGGDPIKLHLVNLTASKKTLKRLAISMKWESGHGDDGPCPSLAAFEVLEHLTICQQLLFSDSRAFPQPDSVEIRSQIYQLLPQSLVSLSLRNGSTGVLVFMEQLAVLKGGLAFPHLISVDIDFQHGAYDASIGDAIKMSLESAGIKTTITEMPEDPVR